MHVTTDQGLGDYLKNVLTQLSGETMTMPPHDAVECTRPLRIEPLSRAR